MLYLCMLANKRYQIVPEQFLHTCWFVLDVVLCIWKSTRNYSFLTSAICAPAQLTVENTAVQQPRRNKGLDCNHPSTQLSLRITSQNHKHWKRQYKREKSEDVFTTPHHLSNNNSHRASLTQLPPLTIFYHTLYQHPRFKPLHTVLPSITHCTPLIIMPKFMSFRSSGRRVRFESSSSDSSFGSCDDGCGSSSSYSSRRNRIYPIGGNDPDRPYCHWHRSRRGKVFRHCHDWRAVIQPLCLILLISPGRRCWEHACCRCRKERIK